MITPHHLIYNSALARRFFPAWPTRAVLAGALFPDVWVWAYFFWYGVLHDTPHQELWGDLYFHSNWNAVFCLAHSFWLLPFLACLGYGLRKPAMLAFFASASFHALCDFSVHHSDAYRHFYPFSDWIFHSPVSYWEPEFGGGVVSCLEALASLVCLAFWYRHTSRRALRWGLIALMLFDVMMLASTIRQYFMG